MDPKNYDIETLLFSYIDKVKTVVSSELWGNMLLNCTTNEMFILVLLYRNSQVNMTQIAEYIGVPLNTATGIVSRMEKKEWVRRERNPEDKRIVTIAATPQGMTQMQNILKEFIVYGTQVLEILTTEEMTLLENVFDKVLKVLNDPAIRTKKAGHQEKIRKISIE